MIRQERRLHSGIRHPSFGKHDDDYENSGFLMMLNVSRVHTSVRRAFIYCNDMSNEYMHTVLHKMFLCYFLFRIALSLVG